LLINKLCLLLVICNRMTLQLLAALQKKNVCPYTVVIALIASDPGYAMFIKLPVD
jgi:hypothetical protein